MLHSLFLAVGLGSCSVLAVTNYANEFIDPQFLLNKTLWDSPQQVEAAIIAGADDLASQRGDWTVTNKTILPPSGDSKDYLSWPPYAWPDCSKVGNKTALTEQQIWTECTYVTRDGQFNPDQHLVNNTGAFYGLSDAIFYNAIAYRINGSSVYSSNIVSIIKAWFTDPKTGMNPNLNYAQLLRGPGKQHGQHTGVLDLKCMAKIASAVLTLRLGNSPEWTSDVDQALKSWVGEYIGWLTTNPLAIGEKTATNNHGSFYYNQLAALYLIADDKDNAKKAVQEFFSGIYQNQIDGKGEQPLEASRTHPYHYRAYNLHAIITNARIGQYAGFDAWQTKTKQNGSIPLAATYAMQFDASASGEAGSTAELYPVVAAVKSVYGDPDGKYSAFLKNADPAEAFFFWDIPTAAGIVNGVETAPIPTHTSTSGVSTSTSLPQKGNSTNGASSLGVAGCMVSLATMLGVCASFALALW